MDILLISVDISSLAYYTSNSCNEPLSYHCNYNEGICDIDSYEIRKEFLPNYEYIYFYNISCANLCNNGYYFKSDYDINTIKELNMSQIYYKNIFVTY
jgi:hypothetical protein